MTRSSLATSTNGSRVARVVRGAARRLDEAVTLGVASVYPLVFNVPAPDPLPDWKHVVRVSLRVVKVTVVQAFRILIK